jgi:hypothetical protein
LVLERLERIVNHRCSRARSPCGVFLSHALGAAERLHYNKAEWLVHQI